ncbi:MAG TPA: TatD family hydrolase [Alphaproteobacteria bacterium]|nr:TatD family hydrolase [Alphaproteobacteria bacterium]
MTHANHNMLLVDVHAHLDIDGFEELGGADKVILESLHAGVKTIVSNATDIESSRKVLEICKKHPNVKAALGIYPTHCLEMIEQGKEKDIDEEILFIEKQIKSGKCIAVGEVGLEYKEVPINDSKKEMQKNALRKFIHLAKKMNVPIILHSRGAEQDTIELLESEGMKNKKVIMHCFSGRKHLVARVRDNGWSFSIPCNVNRSLHFQQIVLDTPLEQLFTETDAPYLSPTPGTVNTPSNVKNSIEKIAELKKMTKEEVANILYSNYQKYFL